MTLEAKLRRVATALAERGFCPTGPGGGIDTSCGSGGGAAKPEDKPKPKKPPKAEKPDAGKDDAKPASTGKFAVGTHVKKTKGQKEECDDLLNSLNDADKSFGGKLSKFLEKNPLEELNVGKMPPGAAESLGVYQSNKQSISIKALKKFNVSLPGEGVDGDVAFKFVDDPDMNRDTLEGQRAVFLHEVGHHIALTAIKKTPGGQKAVYADMIIKNTMDDDNKVSEYAKTSPHEYFAESFSAYHFFPEKLSKQAKKMVEDVMAKGLD